MDLLMELGGLPLSTLAALAAVVLIGLPHGALDGAIANYLGFASKPGSLLRFVSIYLAGGIVVLVTWLIAPVLALSIFLLASLFHFGAGDARRDRGYQRGVEIMAHGGLIIAGISQMHRGEVDVIFGYLVGGQTSLIWSLLDVVSVFTVLAVLFCMAKAMVDRTWRGNGVELLCTGVVIACTPPLVGFALYFCLVHAVRHFVSLVQVIGEIASRKKLILQAVIFTGASWIAGGFAFWSLAKVDSVDSALIRVVFIGLAALTLPHIVLVDGFLSARNQQASNPIQSHHIKSKRAVLDPRLGGNPFPSDLLMNDAIE